MPPTKPITQNLITEWESQKSLANGLEDEITERITFVLKTLFDVFGGTLENWWFDGADEGEVGDLSSNIDNNYVYIPFWNTVARINDDIAIIDKNGNEWVWESKIPARWLFDDDFKEEIVKGKALYEKKKQERLEAKKRAKDLKKKNKEANKVKNNTLIESAKKKLTPEELNALKKSL